MAASRGVDNWNKNWKGQGDIQSQSKVNGGILYEEDGGRVLNVLSKGQPVTYIDEDSKSHTRVAIRVGEDIFYKFNKRKTRYKGRTSRLSDRFS